MSDGNPYDTDDDRSAIIRDDEGNQKSYVGYAATTSVAAEQSKTISRAHIANTTTSSQSMMHLMKGMIGTGILAIPSAIEKAGLWTGFIGILLMGVIATHCMHQLITVSHVLCRRLGCVELNYGKAAENAFKTGPLPLRKFSKAAYTTLNVFLCITQLGFCIVYILFIAENIKEVVEGLSGFDDMPIQAYMAIVTVMLIPLNFIKNLKALAPLSVMANILTVIGLFIIFFYCVQDLPPASHYPAFNSWATLPLYFGTAIYAFEGIGVVLPIENKMKYPEDFAGLLGVMNVSMVVTTCLYAGVGFFGYMKAGPDVKGSITLNLPHTVFYSIVKLCFAVAITISYLLQFYVPFTIVWPKLERKMHLSDQQKYWGEFVGRGVLVIGTFVVAVAIPHLDLMISLIGALASSAIALIFPPMLELLVYWPDQLGRYNWRVVKNVAIMTFGFIGFIAGTTVTLKEIVETF